MTGAPRLTVIVAVKGAEANLHAILKNLNTIAHPDVEFVFCFAGPGIPDLKSRLPLSAKIILAGSDALIPHLWRDGIREASGESIALTTANCVPATDWIGRLKSLDLNASVGIGGTIDNDPEATSANWAIFFLRYSAFAPPKKKADVAEIAADNAVYNRAAILDHNDLLIEGFWEPSFHRCFRAAGQSLELDPAILVTHFGTSSPAEFIGHRYQHGRKYGADRASTQSLPTAILLFLASGLIPVVTLARIVRRIARHRRYIVPLVRSFPWLIGFVLAWSFGEARGYLDVIFIKVRGRAVKMAS
ncbi:hypothetical protein BH09PSE3_BH09PSE3_00260 [soil metagenome]